MLTTDLKHAAFNNEAGINATKMWLNFIDIDLPTENTMQLNATAGLIEGPWVKGPIEESAPWLNLTALPLLSGPAGKCAPVDGYIWAVSAKTAEDPEKRKIAWDIIMELSDVEIDTDLVTEMGFFPLTKAGEQLAAENPWFSTFVDALQYSEPMPNIVESPQIDDILFTQLSRIMTGEVTIEEGLAIAADEVDAVLGS